MQYCTRPTRVLIMTKNHISETLHNIIICVRVGARVIRVSLKCKKTFYLLQTRFKRCDFTDFGRRPRNTKCLKNSYRLILCKPTYEISHQQIKKLQWKYVKIWTSKRNFQQHLLNHTLFSDVCGRCNRLTKIIFWFFPFKYSYNCIF